LTAKLRAALHPLLAGLQAWMQEPPAGRPPSLPSATDAAAPAVDTATALQRLRALLEQDDPAAPEFLQQHAPVLKAALASSFAVVEMHTQNFDFEQALAAWPALSAPGTEPPAIHAP
jgi:two-component system sensor histidine kinase/response regulator